MPAPPDHGDRCIRVALAAPLERPLTYRLAPGQTAGPGQRVLAPLGGRRVAGFVLGPEKEPPAGIEIREIIKVIDEQPLFPAGMTPFFEWLAAYYRHPLGQVIATALPLAPDKQPGGRRRQKTVRAVPQDEPPQLPRVQGQVWEHLAGKDWVPLTILRQIVPGADGAVRTLDKKGLVETAFRRPPGEDSGLSPDPGPPPEPTREQRAVLEEIVPAVKAGQYAPFLLHGVTGSGKTEVYLRAGQAALEAGRTAIILVPEIALTPRLKSLFKSRFGRQVALLHSGLGPGHRQEEWLRLLNGQAKIVLGARSAIFAPLTKVGLIVVDEEHEPSYKQEDGLRYQARDAALYRGRLEGAVVLLGSATPSVVSFEHQRQGKYRGLFMKSRVQKRPLPEVEMVDLRDEPDQPDGPTIFSKRLVEAARETLEQGHQALFFLNRRGFASFPVCGNCGRPHVCPNCSVNLTYHAGFGALVCHYCGLARPLGLCDRCGQEKPRLLGLGTERVTEEAARLFPEARLARFDSDVAGGLRSMEKTLGRLARGEIDILIGTQMLAKGHDFPGIRLVGVILADLSLHLPDFRAAERTFQLLTQVAGRAGRGDIPGQVIIQTLNPDHYSLLTSADQNYQAFFDKEFEQRRKLFYPPLARLIQLRLSGRDRRRVESAARWLTRLARETAGRLNRPERLAVLGPAPAPVAKVKNRYRWLILIKARTAAAGQALLDGLLPLTEKTEEMKGVSLAVDVDPMSMT